MKQHKFKHWTIEVKRKNPDIHRPIQRRSKTNFEFIQLCRYMRRTGDRKCLFIIGPASSLGILVKYVEAYSEYHWKGWSRRKCYDLAHMIRESLLC